MTQAVDAFIARWRDAGGSERANYQLFLTELCTLLELPQPDPSGDDTRDNGYVFERRVIIRHADGSERNGYIDLYRRDSFVCEAKQSGKTLDSSGWDKAMRDQVAAVRLHLTQQPHSAETLARQFKRSPTEKVAAVLDALESLGLVERSEGSYQLLG